MKQFFSNYFVFCATGLVLTNFFSAFAVCPVITPVSNISYTPVNPIVGENLWPMNNRMAEALDAIGPMTSQIATELNEFAYTSSLIYARACYITQADIPYVITAPGVYSLAEPLFFDNYPFDGPMIDIQSDGVELDMCGNLVQTNDDAIFFNGSLININGHKDIVIKNMLYDLFLFNYPIIINNATGIILKNCYARSRVNAPHINIVGSSNITLQNNVVQDGGMVFQIDSSSVITINNCTAYPFSKGLRITNSHDVLCDSFFVTSQQAGVGRGIDIDSNSSRITLQNCQVNKFNEEGFFIGASEATIENCRSFENQHGFWLAGHTIELIGSFACNNVNSGIVNINQVADVYVFNCLSAGNGSTDYYYVPNVLAYASITSNTGYWTNIGNTFTP